MSHLATARWTIALLLAGAANASAQLSGAAGVGASLQREGGGLWQSLTRLEPAARLTNPWLQLGGNAAFVSSNRQMQLENGSVDLTAETPAWNGFRLSSTGQIERHDAFAGFSRTGGNVETALSYGTNGRGAWFGVASEHPIDRGASKANSDGDGLFRFGLWQQLGPVTVVFGSSQHQASQIVTGFRMQAAPDSLNPDDSVRVPTSNSALRRWSDAQARVLWSFGRVALDGQFGFQSRLDSSSAATWARATAIVGVSSRLSLVGAVGRAPERAWAGVPGARFATLGVRIAPASLSRPIAPAHVQPSANRFVVRPAESGSYVVTISVPSARTVELSGDFNAWHPVSLKETRPDVWEVTVPLAPGTYHVNMRVNGASWIAPPGLSQTSDDFNGSVGLLVVR